MAYVVAGLWFLIWMYGTKNQKKRFSFWIITMIYFFLVYLIAWQSPHHPAHLVSMTALFAFYMGLSGKFLIHKEEL